MQTKEGTAKQVDDLNHPFRKPLHCIHSAWRLFAGVRRTWTRFILDPTLCLIETVGTQKSLAPAMKLSDYHTSVGRSVAICPGTRSPIDPSPNGIDGVFSWVHVLCYACSYRVCVCVLACLQVCFPGYLPTSLLAYKHSIEKKTEKR